MPPPRSSNADAGDRPLSGPPPTSYLEVSRRPLASLALLLPLLVFHELAVIFGHGSSGSIGTGTVVAYRMIERTMASVGWLAQATPAILCVVVLVGAHVFRRYPWDLRLWVPVAMAVESLLWAALLFAAQASWGLVLLASPGGGGTATGGVSLMDQLTLAIGAGLYEELLFRALFVGAGALLLRQVLGASERLSSIAAIGVSAVLFALYHDLGGGTFFETARLLVVYCAAGVFLGLLYLARGLGIAAAAHAVYDIAVIGVIAYNESPG
ncbi:MAG: CPBP family intramembrane glutamic endopeptidase [Planctomycetota bacterium]